MTALHVACLSGHTETAEALLDGGSAIEAADNVNHQCYILISYCTFMIILVYVVGKNCISLGLCPR